MTLVNMIATSFPAFSFCPSVRLQKMSAHLGDEQQPTEQKPTKETKRIDIDKTKRC